MAEKITKASVIRTYLEKHPEMKPKEMTELILKEHKEIKKLTPQEVSTTKSNLMKKQQGEAGAVAGVGNTTPRQARARAADNGPGKVTTGLAGTLSTLKQLVDVFGKEEITKIVNEVL